MIAFIHKAPRSFSLVIFIKWYERALFFKSMLMWNYI